MISIIIPTYNNVKSLIALLNTILLEQYNTFEIIIIDDASTDNTQMACNKINDKRVKYYCNPKTIGTTKSRLRGIQFAKGMYIKFFDDDDLWISNVLNKQAECLNTQNYSFVFGNYKVHNSIDNVEYTRNLSSYQSNFTKQLLKQPGPFFQACLFKTNFIKKYAKYLDNRAEPSEDWDFFISLTYNTMNVIHLNKTIFQWNYNHLSQSADYKQETYALAYIVKKHKDQIIKRGSSKIMAQHYRILGSRFYYIHNYQKSYNYYKKAFTTYPYAIKNILHRILQFFPSDIKNFSYNYINKKIIN